jgi:hypothetical protein
MGKARSGFTPGVAKGSTPSQTGSHSPAATGARVITGADRPAVINTVPKSATDSTDGVVRTPHRETHQGWHRNENVSEVES